MQTITVCQMVKTLLSAPQDLKSWERDLVSRAHDDSHHGLKPQLLSSKQVEIVASIFRRIYNA